MCLIIDNPDGRAIDADLVARALDGNPDGWGFMASRRRRIHVTRGLTSAGLDDALKAHAGIPHTVHFRYGTHGDKSLANCHPFSVLGGKYAMVHNGILDIPRCDADRSDTWHFTEHVLGPILAASPELFGGSYLTDLLKSLIGAGNKIVIMRADGKTIVVNRDAGCEHDGLWLSNSHSLRVPSRSLAVWPTWDPDWRDDELETSGWTTDDELKPPATTDTIGDLSQVAELEDNDLTDFVCDYPESVASMIRSYFGPNFR